MKDKRLREQKIGIRYVGLYTTDLCVSSYIYTTLRSNSFHVYSATLKSSTFKRECVLLIDKVHALAYSRSTGQYLWEKKLLRFDQWVLVSQDFKIRSQIIGNEFWVDSCKIGSGVTFYDIIFSGSV